VDCKPDITHEDRLSRRCRIKSRTLQKLFAFIALKRSQPLDTCLFAVFQSDKGEQLLRSFASDSVAPWHRH